MVHLFDYFKYAYFHRKLSMSWINIEKIIKHIKERNYSSLDFWYIKTIHILTIRFLVILLRSLKQNYSTMSKSDFEMRVVWWFNIKISVCHCELLKVFEHLQMNQHSSSYYSNINAIGLSIQSSKSDAARTECT